MRHWRPNPLKVHFPLIFPVGTAGFGQATPETDGRADAVRLGATPVRRRVRIDSGYRPSPSPLPEEPLTSEAPYTMAQNIYDDPEFFAAYSKFRRSVLGLAGAAEWPALRALLPPMLGLRVVDLGCGFGWFCRWAREAGAASVLGVDISENMLSHARATISDDGVRYVRADLDDLDLPEGGFHLAYSSLALHYVENLEHLLQTIRRAIAAGGTFVFSVEHPIYMAPSNPAWVTLADGRTVWPLDSYQREGPRSTDWLASGVIKHHRTLGTIVNLLVEQGFTIRHVEEWRPSPDQVARAPQAAEEMDRPMFSLIGADVRSV